MLYIKDFIKDMRSTGSIAPSSRFLARNITRLLHRHLEDTKSAPVRILEIGPGSGVLTQQILRYLRPDDHLDIVEINQHFFEVVNGRYSHLQNVHVYHLDFLKFEEQEKYDYIFSSLPYESLPTRISRQIWKKKLNYCKDGSFITYYKYLNFNRFKCKYEKAIVSRYCMSERVVFRNLPPAKLFTLKINNQETVKAPIPEKKVLVRT